MAQGNYPLNVWLDVDPAAGLEDRDVDDALAMIQAFNSPSLKIHGVSVVYGNAELPDGVRIAREVVERFAFGDMGVHAGAANARQLGEESDATRALAEALRERPMTILALGPLTNMGAFVKHHPELVDRIESMVVVAGRRVGQRLETRPDKPGFPDFNFENDPAAMAALLETKIPLVFAPWEVSSHVWLRSGDLAELSETGGPGAWIHAKSQSWLGFWKRTFDVDGFNPFDTLAVGWLTHPELIESMTAHAWIDEGPDDLATDAGPEAPLKTKPYLLVDPERPGGRPVTYCYRPKPEFKTILLERLAGSPIE